MAAKSALSDDTKFGAAALMPAAQGAGRRAVGRHECSFKAASFEKEGAGLLRCGLPGAFTAHPCLMR